MFVFWKYDNRFGCLGGRMVGEVGPGGRVRTETFGNATVLPLAFLPDEEGAEIDRKLDEILAECNAEVKKIKAAYRDKALAIAPFLKR